MSNKNYAATHLAISIVFCFLASNFFGGLAIFVKELLLWQRIVLLCLQFICGLAVVLVLLRILKKK